MLITHEDDIAAFAKRVIRLLDGRVVSDEVQLDRRRGGFVNLAEAVRIALRGAAG